MNTIKFNYIWFVLFSGILFFSCTDDDNYSLEKEVSAIEENKINGDDLEWTPGLVYVKLKTEKPAVVTRVMSTLREESPATRSSQNLKYERVFNLTGEWEIAMKREGLDKWYKISFDKEIEVQKVIDDLAKDKNVEVVHGDLPIERNEVTYTPVSNSSVPMTRAFTDVKLNNGYVPFTNADPLLTKQWHYQTENSGTRGISIGSDINLFQAWDKTKGDPKVIVAVVDSGMDTEHPDLKGAMWSDEQGHHGKNFVDDNYVLAAGFHGTHTGGTIGARNNNGIGVCGVAGGDGTDNSGVRLMSCQIFGADDSQGNSKAATADQISKAFIWAAQNGAVLANCSWGFPWKKKESAESYERANKAMGALIQAGIDFFTKYAGNDPEKLQQKPSSLMSGGLVMFASGNDSARDIEIIPSSSPAVVAVAAFDSEYKLTEYSNIGRWVDIVAPGGDVVNKFYIGKYAGVLSTVPSSFGSITIGGEAMSKYLYDGKTQYAYAQGTSMATPHVTGIAALIVSHFGKQGYTNKELRERLLGAVKAKDFYEVNNDLSLVGRTGAGYIDAGMALSEPEKVAPNPVELEVADVNYYDASIKWKVSDDSDAITENKVAFAYEIYFSEEPIDIKKERFDVAYSHKKESGEQLTYKFEDLKSDQKYYVGIIAKDRSGNVSTVVTKEFTTKLNHLPTITNPIENIVIPATEPYYAVQFNVKDEENHAWSLSVDKLPAGVTLEKNEKHLDLKILVNNNIGEYELKFMLIDELNGKKTETIKYKIVKHSAPQLITELKDLSLRLGAEPAILDLNETFAFNTGNQAYEFSAVSNNVDIADVRIEENKLIVTPKKKGSVTVVVKVNDGMKEAETSFQVNITDRKASDLYALYPSPAHSYVKMLFHANVETVDVMLTSIRGELLMNKKMAVDSESHVLTLEVDRLVPGLYNLIVKSNSATTKRTFVKN